MRKHGSGFLGLLALLGLGLAVPSAAQQETITRQQAEAILRELQEIRQLLEQLVRANQARPAPPVPEAKVRIRAREGYSLGREDAPLTLVEFTDYQCSFCRRFHQDSFPKFVKDYVETGQVRFVTRDLPLRMHGNAQQAAHAARCAGEQGKFWEMRDVLIKNAQDLAAPSLARYAEQLPLEMNSFRACQASLKYTAEIQKDIEEANRIGITGTPAFVLGKTTKDGLEGIKIVGAKPYSFFEARIKELLSANPTD